MRHTLFYISLLFVFAACTPTVKKGNSILDVVPHTATLVFKINDVEALKENLATNEILSALTSSPLYTQIKDKVYPLSLLSNPKTGLLAFSAIDSTSFDFTYITNDTLAFKDWGRVSNKSIETLSYRDYNIIKYEVDEQLFYQTSIATYHIISSSKPVLEDLIDTAGQQDIPSSLSTFYSVSDASKSMNIWMDLSNGKQLFNQLLPKNELAAFSSYMSLDLNLEDTEIALNGITQTHGTDSNYLSLFRNLKPATTTLSELVPSEASYFKCYVVDDFRKFSKNKTANNNASTPLDSLLNTVEEIGLAEIDGEKVLFLRTYGTATLLDYLNAEKIGAEEYGGNELLELIPNTQILEAVRPLIGTSSFTHASILENTFVFAESKNVLQSLLGKVKSGDVFHKTNVFKNADEALTSSSSILTISNLIGATKLLQESVSNSFGTTIGESELDDYVFSSQFIADEGFFHSNFLIKKITDTPEKNTVSSMFNLQFETGLATVPQFVINHNSGKKEIVVQDQEHMLYLVSNSGKVIWKKQLAGAIQGNIQQVDLYKNGKLQLAFTTNNEFLVIDRNGKEVAPFTMKYPGGNLNPLAVFDYEGKKEYRFLVTQGAKVYMYNNNGNTVKGFKYKVAESAILNAPQHFRIGNRDYIVLKLDDGQLKILNRVGDDRIRVKTKFAFSENPVVLYQNKFTFSSAEGMLHQIDTKGTLTQSDLSLIKDHGLDATSKTLAIINDNVLQIRDKKIQLELGVYSKPTIFYLNDKIYVSVTDIQNQQIYLYDSQAEPIPNFPIFGSSVIDLADMDNDKNPELLFKDQENSLSVFKIR
ncbi:MAG: ribonuclease HII [Maribacter sp.]